MKKALTTLVCTAATAATVSATTSNERVRPNIVLINIDDLGWADLSSNSSTYYQTPNIDRLRSQGIYFPNAYAAAANSAPSRAAMITGKYSPRHGIYTVNPPDRGAAADRKLIAAPNADELPLDMPTMALHLQQNGYRTMHVGKWHLGADPTRQGFHINVGGNKAGHPKSYFSPYKNPNLSDGVQGEFLTERLTHQAIGLIEEHSLSDAPFFLYFATYAIHTPLQARPELVEKYKNRAASEAHFNPTYAALVETADAAVGRLLAALDSLSLDRSTLVIFTSDNGGVYDLSRQWPLRAGKGSFYEGGIRVPMIFRWTGITPRGKECTEIVSQIDLFPTLCAMSNTHTTEQLDGVNIETLVVGKAEKLAPRSLYWHFPAYLEGGNAETRDPKFRSRPVSVVRRGDWKMIRNIEDGSVELYNLAADIGEKNDVSQSNPNVIKQLTSDMDAWIKSTAAPVPSELNPKYRE